MSPQPIQETQPPGQKKGGTAVSAPTRYSLFAIRRCCAWWHFLQERWHCGLALDHTWPFWDGASHVLDSIEYRQLFRHPHLLDGSWWHDLLTVNFCYAPQLHAWFGFMKLLMGPGLLAEQVCQVLFCALMCFSVYNISYLCYSDRVCGLYIGCIDQFISASHASQSYDLSGLCLSFALQPGYALPPALAPAPLLVESNRARCCPGNGGLLEAGGIVLPFRTLPGPSRACSLEMGQGEDKAASNQWRHRIDFLASLGGAQIGRPCTTLQPACPLTMTIRALLKP